MAVGWGGGGATLLAENERQIDETRRQDEQLSAPDGCHYALGHVLHIQIWHQNRVPNTQEPNRMEWNRTHITSHHITSHTRLTAMYTRTQSSLKILYVVLYLSNVISYVASVEPEASKCSHTLSFDFKKILDIREHTGL